MIRVKRVGPRSQRQATVVVALSTGFGPGDRRKSNLALDGWFKEVAPSDSLRKWFGHDAKKWKEFRKQYFAELRVKPETWQVIGTVEISCIFDVTLLYSARDSEHNNAVALRGFLIAKLRKRMSVADFVRK